MHFTNKETIWEMIAQDGYDVEHSMEPLHRKRTGSYYTALELALAMMREMVESLPEEKKRSLFDCTFLEPCAGTGNFVFAYLRVCSELGYTANEYKKLLDNIYVCDTNTAALAVYRKNLTLFSKEWFGIALDEHYFTAHIGSGLLAEVDSESTRYIPVTDVFPSEVVQSGFDFVVTNPPYKNLKAERSHYNTEAEYSKDKTKYSAIRKLADGLFPCSSAGTLNLYKLFVEEIIRRYLAPNGIGSLLIPASILSDKTCSKLRTLLLDTAALRSIRLIAEDSSFVDASQALCAMLFCKGKKSDAIIADGSFHGDRTAAISVDASDLIDPAVGNALLILTQEQYAQRHQMRMHPTIGTLEYIKNLRGELDITLNKNAITQTDTGYRLIRGRHIGYYAINDSGNTEYVHPDFAAKTAKRRYIENTRLACQQIANMTKKRRISFAPVPAGCVLGNSCNFIAVAPNEDGVDLYFLLGVLNSSLIDWYFRLTSSNNHVNNYEINNFPIPVSCQNKSHISHLVQQLLKTRDQSLVEKIEILVREAYGLTTAERSFDGQNRT